MKVFNTNSSKENSNVLLYIHEKTYPFLCQLITGFIDNSLHVFLNLNSPT